MSIVYPSYYPEFHCLAGACRHSCCVGWEIDIDPRSLERYSRLPGPLGEELRRCISHEDTSHFILTEGERCPFLRGDGLCRLILSGGQELLCQICADHPRFRNFLPGREEIGLGLCCQAAAELILSRQEPVSLVEQGTEEEHDPEAEVLLELRRRAFGLAQERTLPLEVRCDRLLRLCGSMEPGHPADWADVLLGLERLDPAWTALLEELALGGREAPAPEEPEVVWEQLLVYFLYRHLLGAWEDGNVGGRAAFAVMSVRLLRCLRGLHPRLPLAELCRMYSAEVEYSEDNLQALLEECSV